MQQSFDKFLSFQNRLEKVYRHLSKQARRQGISCYRIYDHDLPEAPFIIEVYEDKLYVSEYKRKHHLSDGEYDQWLDQSKEIISKVTGISTENIFLKMRQRKEGRGGQYQKIDEQKNEFIVQEAGLKFLVNLSDYLDTGLFLDHRITRQMVKEQSNEKRVLNLFCYTGSFSVYAIAGNAGRVVSVDLSKTYLAWAERNKAVNFNEYKNHEIVHADVLKYLKELAPGSFDLIVMDPPTFSNSKRMEDILDIQRDHVVLINQCMKVLASGGLLYFSTNYTKFQLRSGQLHATQIKDITKLTTPFDFAGKLKRQCFVITK
ncbi:MAG: methyltransferase domain-containing protein [Chitinophagaceae bacterium]|nr:MAG: methyltransferase domain-containing protein [Chitinophagaceae bacterium]